MDPLFFFFRIAYFPLHFREVAHPFSFALSSIDRSVGSFFRAFPIPNPKGGVPAFPLHALYFSLRAGKDCPCSTNFLCFFIGQIGFSCIPLGSRGPSDSSRGHYLGTRFFPLSYDSGLSRFFHPGGLFSSFFGLFLQGLFFFFIYGSGLGCSLFSFFLDAFCLFLFPPLRFPIFVGSHPLSVFLEVGVDLWQY